jgi:hypothetical protein
LKARNELIYAGIKVGVFWRLATLENYFVAGDAESLVGAMDDVAVEQHAGIRFGLDGLELSVPCGRREIAYALV